MTGGVTVVKQKKGTNEARERGPRVVLAPFCVWNTRASQEPKQAAIMIFVHETRDRPFVYLRM